MNYKVPKTRIGRFIDHPVWEWVVFVVIWIVVAAASLAALYAVGTVFGGR